MRTAIPDRWHTNFLLHCTFRHPFRERSQLQLIEFSTEDLARTDIFRATQSSRDIPTTSSAFLRTRKEARIRELFDPSCYFERMISSSFRVQSDQPNRF